MIATVQKSCAGSTALTRNRFKEHFFLDLEIFLSPLEEQQRTVPMAKRVEEAKRLGERTTEETKVHLFAILDRAYKGKP